MIQRIQTLFLLIVAGLAAALFFLPAFVSRTTIPTLPVKEVSYMVQSNILTSIVVALSGLMALVSIFLFRNRQRQMLLCRLNLLFILAALGLILEASDTSSLPRPDQISIHYALASFFPVAQILFNWLALRFIKKDDDLVRSAERLR